MNIPTIAADISATKVAPNKALSPKADKIGFFPEDLVPLYTALFGGSGLPRRDRGGRFACTINVFFHRIT